MQNKYYQDFVKRQFRGTEPLENKNLKDRFIYTVGLAGETGEVLELLKKDIRDNKQKPDELLLELGDVLFYLTCIASAEGFTLDELMDANYNKLQARNAAKYLKENFKMADLPYMIAAGT